MCVGVEAEEGLDGFDGALVLIVPVAAGLALGVAAHLVRVDGEHASRIMPARSSYLSERSRQVLRIRDRVRAEQFINGVVRGDKRQSVGQLEAFWAQATTLADAGSTQGGLIDQL